MPFQFLILINFRPLIIRNFQFRFLDQELIHYCFSSYSSCSSSACWGDAVQITLSLRRFNPIWVKFGTIVLQVNTCRSMESGYWYDVIC